MSKFYERRYKPQKDEVYTNYAITYFRKELDESNRYLVTPQERENMVALVYRANPGDQNARLVQLKAQKCSCLAFQDHKIPCRHAIAACRFFNAKPEDYIATFYQISEYREQYKYSLVPVLLDDLEPDGVTKPPPEAPLRGRPVKKRIKRTTRETEARRVGNLASSSSRKERQDEARIRHQSGVTYSSQLDPTSIVEPHTLMQRNKAFQAHPEESGMILEPCRTEEAHGSRSSEYEQSPTVQAPTKSIEYSTSQAQPPREQHVFQEIREPPPLDMFEQQRSSNSQFDAAASEVTYIDSTVTNNNFTFGTSNSVPNITISVTTSPPGANKRPVRSGDEDDSSVQSEEPPALSTRSRKRSRMDR